MSITAILEEGRVAHSEVSSPWDAFGIVLFFPFPSALLKRRVMKQSEKQEVLEIICHVFFSISYVCFVFQPGLDLFVDGAALR